MSIEIGTVTCDACLKTGVTNVVFGVELCADCASLLVDKEGQRRLENRVYATVLEVVNQLRPAEPPSVGKGT